MTPLVGSIVDGQALLETVIASFVAGVGVTIVFSLAILGAALFGDGRREGRPSVAVGGAALMTFGLIGAVAATAFGIVVMTS